jgi:hypothetical protein
MEPLIYTSKGNLPLADLAYETAWDITDTYIKFVERHRDSTGEVVREAAHVYSLKGLTGGLEAGSVG